MENRIKDMKILVVAHPDDEILWFVPNIFDKIVIAFCDRHDKIFFGDARRRALEEHPLKDIIINLNIVEAGYWKDNSRTSFLNIARHNLICKLKDVLSSLSIETVFTHNSIGEYGHDDHILVHDVCLQLFKRQQIFCPPKELNDSADLQHIVDHDLFFKVKDVYLKHKVWTWKNDHVLPQYLQFNRIDNDYS